MVVAAATVAVVAIVTKHQLLRQISARGSPSALAFFLSPLGGPVAAHLPDRPTQLSLSHLAGEARWRALIQLQEVLQDLPPALRENALRMKLHAPDRILLVLQAHDFALVGLGGDFEAVGH